MRQGLLRNLWRNCSGASAAEFALVLPLLLTLLFGVIKLGLVLNNDAEIINGARATARVIAVARGSTTPWSDANTTFKSSTSNVATAAMSVLVNGAACSSDSGCQALLTNSAGLALTVIATAPCDLQIMGVDFAPKCQLQTQTVERIE
jgi:Flp pilus assembly protein TadG